MRILAPSSLVPVLALVSAFAAAPAGAAGEPEAAKGIVAEYCASCHVTPGIAHSGEAAPLAPAFADIADDPQTYTPERVRAFLKRPHWPMERFILSERDIDNIVAYLESLRSTEGQR